MEHAFIRKALRFLVPTPLHPQWFSFLEENKTRTWIKKTARGTTLDIGCAGSRIHPHLIDDSRYIGLDYYPAAIYWYNKIPHIYGDAQVLPVRTASIDSVLLIDVLEHLPRPESCLAEIERVLKDGGVLMLQVPFLYPLHEEPLDFQRLTVHGLKELLQKHGFSVEEATSRGKPLATATLLANLALGKTISRWFNKGNPLALLAILFPVFVLFTNLSAWLLALLSPSDGMMPHSYRLLCIKEGKG